MNKGRPTLSMAHRCCSKQKVKRGLWSPEEDEKLAKYVTAYGHGCWSSVPKRAGLQRCGKSCRLRWINYLRPDLKRGSFSLQEERAIIDAHRVLGNRWAQIAKHLPGRTDNEVKNFWNSCIKKRLIAQGIDPKTHGALKEDISEQKKAPCSSTHQRNCLPNTSSSPHDGRSPFHSLRLNGNITEANASAFLCSGQNVLGLPSYANPVVGDWMGKASPSKHISNLLTSCVNLQMMKPLEQVDFQSNDGSSRHDANVQSSGCNIPRGSSSWHLDFQSPITHNLDQNDGNLDCGKRSIVGLESMNTPSLLFSATETNQYDVLRPHFPINLTELGPHDQPTGSLIDVPSYGPPTVVLNDQIYMSNHNYSPMSARLPEARYAESSESGVELAAARDQEQCATANITVQLPKLCDLELDQCNSVAGETTEIQFPSHAHIHDHFGLDLFDSSLPVGIHYENNIMHNALTQWGL